MSVPVDGASGERPGPAREELRRRDRSKDDAWIRAFLRRAPFGFLATTGEGRVWLNSNLFLFDDRGGADRIYLHTARTGRTPAQVEAWSGKEKLEDADFPGAYTLPGPVPPVAGGGSAG